MILESSATSFLDHLQIPSYGKKNKRDLGTSLKDLARKFPTISKIMRNQRPMQKAATCIAKQTVAWSSLDLMDKLPIFNFVRVL